MASENEINDIIDTKNTLPLQNFKESDSDQ